MTRATQYPSVLHVTAEVAPFSQTGGLGDVTRDLPTAQRKLEQQSVVVSPLYGCVDRTSLSIMRSSLEVSLGGKNYTVAIWQDRNGVHWFVDAPGLLDRPHLYGDSNGDYDDNPLRFAVFCKVAAVIGRDFDILHLHDWQAAMTALYAHGVSSVVLSVHNLAYQGLCSFDWAEQLELPIALHDLNGAEYYGQISMLKVGLVLADRITTVSPTYAKEIQNEPGGQGLSGLFIQRQAILSGILNGLDYTLWDPSTDTCLPHQFDTHHLSPRHLNRGLLFEQYGLKEGVLFSVVSRAATQKGLHLITEQIDPLIDAGARFIFLASGQADIMTMLETCARQNPDTFRLIPNFDPKIAKCLYGGSDYVLVPSLYEPCGLTQLMAMRYGSVPIVRRTGGLADTVTHEENGLCFEAPDSDACAHAILTGLEFFEAPDRYSSLQQRAMRTDFSWTRAQESYAQLYKGLISQRLGDKT